VNGKLTRSKNKIVPLMNALPVRGLREKLLDFTSLITPMITKKRDFHLILFHLQLFYSQILHSIVVISNKIDARS